MKNLKLHTPNGLSDMLPKVYQRKRAVERKIETVFEQYGYEFVSSPTLEYLAVFEGKGSIPVTEMYKLGDRNGEMLALRPDMTPALVRMVTTHNLIEEYDSAEDPVRLCYTEKSFRNYENFQGKENEFTQAGAELMGVSSPEADAELIALSIQGLLATGLTNFRVDIGHIDFLSGVLNELETALSESERQTFIKHMIDRDYVEAEAIAEKAKHIVPAGLLLSDFTQLTGGIDMLERTKSMISKSNTLAQNALEHLGEVYNLLKDQDLLKYILLDLSMTGQLDYYTGIIFKGYAKGSGTTVVDGGRYDQLLAAFNAKGRPIPAVGFGIKIEGLLDALTAQNIEFEHESTYTLLAYHESARSVALATGDIMRRQGLRIENSLICGDLAVQKAYALRRKLKGILYFTDPETVLLVGLETGQEEKVAVEELKNPKC